MISSTKWVLAATLRRFDHDSQVFVVERCDLGKYFMTCGSGSHHVPSWRSANSQNADAVSAFHACGIWVGACSDVQAACACSLHVLSCDYYFCFLAYSFSVSGVSRLPVVLLAKVAG
jgi:hypothetical protein